MASKTVSIARLPQFLLRPRSPSRSGLELGGLLPPLALASPSPYDLHVPHEPRTSYDLYAAAWHHGQDGSGHYTTLVRDGGAEEDGDGWCEIDDEVVTRLETPDAIDEALLRAERSAYLLFYRIGDAA
ncbi:ubiquitin-specific protease doa4 [Rhodotorula sphaerocarpa]